MLNNQFDDRWKQLKSIQPTPKQKAVLRERLRQTLMQQTVTRTPKKTYQWRAFLATCVFILICGGVLWKVIADDTLFQTVEPKNAEEQPVTINDQFSWGLKDAYIEKSLNGWDIVSKENSSIVGSINIITEKEIDEIKSTLPIFVKGDLDNFPYATSMNIEHVKMMDTAIRYHFFIPIENENFVHFTFDYPKLEHAEIFQAMATLEIAGIAPVKYNEQLYVRHGYGTILYPVGLEPISISPEKEVYHWENASDSAYRIYLDKIQDELSNWKRESDQLETTTFESGDGKQIVSIALNEKNLTFEFTYLYDVE